VPYILVYRTSRVYRLGGYFRGLKVGYFRKNGPNFRVFCTFWWHFAGRPHILTWETWGINVILKGPSRDRSGKARRSVHEAGEGTKCGRTVGFSMGIGPEGLTNASRGGTTLSTLRIFTLAV
jgi:hypothetical protein